MATNTDGRERLVLRAFADIYSQNDDLFELGFRDMNPIMGTAQTLQIPASPTMTVNEGTTGTADSITNTFLDLEASKALSMFVTLPQLSQLQNLGGNSMISFGQPGMPRNQWAMGTLNDALLQLKKRRSQLAFHYLQATLAWTSAAATYYNNVEGDTLTEADVVGCISELESLDGAHDIALFMHPFGLAALSVIPGWQPMPTNGNVGAPVGQLFGKYPVYNTTSILRGNPPGASPPSTAPSGAIATAYTATAVASSSGTYTCTTPSGHGFILGEKVYAPNLDNAVTEANAGTISTSTANQVIFASGSATDGNELSGGTYAGLLVPAGIRNLVVDRAHMFRCQQIQPVARIVDAKGDVDDELQITARFGFIGRTGRARVLMTPKTTL